MRVEHTVSVTVLEIKNISKQFGDKKVLNAVNLEVKEGEFVSLLGPSGCGKTTLLRIIAGHDQPTQGQVWLKQSDITQKLAYDRPIHTVFQRYALFPHMNVFDNVAFGLRCQKVSGRSRAASEIEIKKSVEEALSLVNLGGQGHRAISTLSGGEQQRVALVRALVNRPELLLLDEPLGALDHKLRLQLQQELVTIQKKFKTTFVFVTHDQQEALNMSDRVAVLNNGNLEQVGTPHEIYESPKTFFVAQFVGSINVLEGVVKEKVSEVEFKVEVQGCGEFRVEIGFSQNTSGETLMPAIGSLGYLCVRPEKLMIYSKRPTTMANTLEGVIKTQTYLGTYTQFEVTLKNKSMPEIDKETYKDAAVNFLVFQQNTQKLPKKNFKNGDSVHLGWQANASHFFKK